MEIQHFALILLLVNFTTRINMFIKKTCKIGAIDEKKGEVYVVAIFSSWLSANKFPLKKEPYLHSLAVRLNVQRRNIGFITYNICENEEALLDILLTITLDKKFSMSSKNTGGRFPSRKIPEHEKHKKSNILIVLGYLPETMIKLAADIFLPTQIPFSSTEQYSIFPDVKHSHPRFLTVFGDGEPYNHILRLIDHFKWKNIGLVNLNARNEKFVFSLNKTFNELATKVDNYCVSSIQLDINDDFSHITQTLNSDTSINVVVVWGDDEALQQFLNIVKIVENKTWIVLGKPYFVHDKLKFINTKIIDGLFILVDNYETLAPEPLTKLVSKLTWSEKEGWLKSHFDDRLKKETEFGLFTVVEKSLFTHLYRIIKAFTVNYWRGNIENVHLKGFEKVRNSVIFYNVNYTGLNRWGKTKVDKKQFLSTEIPDNLYWPQNSNSPTISKCYHKSCPPGFESKFNYLLQNETLWGIAYGWSCRKCKDGHFKATDSIKACTQCKGVTLSFADGTGCYDPYINKFFEFKNMSSVLSLILASIGASITIFIASVFFKYRKTPCVKSTDTFRTLFQLFISILFYPIFFFLAIAKPSAITCTSIPFYVGASFTVTYSITLAKTQKLLFAFQAKVKLSSTQVLMSKATEMAIVGVAVLIQISLFTVTIVQRPIHVTQSLNEKKLERDIFCNSYYHLHVQVGFLLILSIICNVQAFRARTLPQNFNEAKYIVYATLVTNLCFVVMFILYYGQHDQTSKTYVNIIALLLVNLLFIPFLYGYKVYIILAKPEQNTVEAFHKEMMANMRENVNKSTEKQERKKKQKNINTKVCI